MKTLDDWLLHLEGLHPKGQAGIELGLDRIRLVKAALGQTQHCPVIVVGGTNGKGSTCAYLENIIDRAGYKVGCYTSPHLLAYNERVRLNGRPVADEALCAAFARVEAARQQAGSVALTYFEFGTLAAWEVFAAAGVEAAILEVGLGGRLDAVNAYEPDVSIVTTVALDHTDWLGPDRERIGFEKAGIYRSGKPAFCADPQPPHSLLDHAATIGADLRLIGRDFGFERPPADSGENRLQWRWWCRSGERLLKRSLAYPGLRGPTQLYNAAVALAALEALVDRLPVTMQAIRPGLIETELTGRFQVLPGKPAIVLDVGHNPQAIKVLADNLANMGFFNSTHAVLGMLKDKDIVGALLPLKGKIDIWHLATLPGPRGATAETLAAVIVDAGLGGEIVCHASPAAAMQAAKGGAAESDRILAFGSFYTVAGALQALRKKP
ncbi:bifunctional tetrahydrofolate synthase/dihydrofolate synthase [Dechloromonas denitrificans]|uniref:bifunctional tetrahydrofolate synthase/dihydrofolate synthase n=1 Tax=Dechloromonas denitrificans TaxID=281362 RepID=UPI001CF84D78|nr:bifunctional tetrahydrofolate synthase/dihydrofolate synthase [Dechloromonas denitrificans]UCV02855.1 bifunctional tetrahydrofolate synthase/dihydrofolate synthase [Dechloromonas denitrificans]